MLRFRKSEIPLFCAATSNLQPRRSESMRRIAVATLIAGLVAFTGIAQADPLLQEAFASMTTSPYSTATGAKTYNGTLRSGVDFGSGRIVGGGGTSNVSLVNFTPPQFTAGCGGIDWHLGGISWINWDQFREILNEVVMSAQYAVVSIMLDYISEKLSSTFKSVMTALQAATTMEIDSCKIGRDLVKNAFDAAIPNMDKSQSFCQDNLVLSGSQESRSSAGEVCKNVAEAREEGRKTYKKWLADLGLAGMFGSDGDAVEQGADDERTPAPAGCVGNCTWTTLRAAGFVPTLNRTTSISASGATTTDEQLRYVRGVANGELLMSLLGFSFSGDFGGATGNPEKWTSIYGNQKQVAPNLTAENYVAIYMCGTSYILSTSDNEAIGSVKAVADAGTDAAVKEQAVAEAVKSVNTFCQQLKKVSGATAAAQVKITTCLPETTASSLSKDQTSGTVDMDSGLLGSLSGGYAMREAKDLCLWPAPIPLSTWAAQPYVQNSLLGEGLLSRNIAIMQGILQKMIAGNQALSSAEQDFIVTAPLPVYQMLSSAALFPTQGLAMVQNQAILISALQMQALLDRITSDAAKAADPKIGIDEKTMKELLSYFSKIQDVFGGANYDVDKQLDRMLALQAQVKTLQTAVMDSIYGKGLMGNMTFSADIAAMNP